MSNTIRFPNIKARYMMMSPANAFGERQNGNGNVVPQTIWQFYGGTQSLVYRS